VGRGVYIQDNTPMINKVIYHKGGGIIQGSILPRIATFNHTLGIALG